MGVNVWRHKSTSPNHIFDIASFEEMSDNTQVREGINNWE